MFVGCASTQPIYREPSSLFGSCKEIVNGFFKKKELTTEEIYLKELLKIEDVILSGDIELIKNTFRKYAEQNGIKYKELDGVFYVLPDRNASKLNRFIDSTVSKKKIKSNKDIQFKFDPEKAHMYMAAYHPLEGDITLSLRSIFQGVPTNSEIHEIVHLEEDLAFHHGKNVLLRGRILPRVYDHIAEGISYAKGMSFDELKTYGIDLRIYKKYLLDNQILDKDAKANLSAINRSTINIMSENIDVFQKEFSKFAKAASDLSSKNKLETKIETLENGREYATIIFPYINYVKIDFNDGSSIRTVKRFLEASDKEERYDAYKFVVQKFSERANLYEEMANQLQSIVSRMKEKSANDSYLFSEDLFKDLEAYRLVISDFEARLETAQ